jgi:hypothetical protein
MPTKLFALSLVALIALALPGFAAASGDDVIRDCAQDGDLDKQYSDEELEDANRNLPSDIDQYSDCRDVIAQAQAGGRGGSTGGSGSGGGAGGSSDGGGTGGGATTGDRPGQGGTADDASELGIRRQQAEAGVAPDTSAATAAGADVGDDDSGLPTAALVAIVLLGLSAVAGGVYLLRDYLPSGLTSRLPGASR